MVEIFERIPVPVEAMQLTSRVTDDDLSHFLSHWSRLIDGSVLFREYRAPLGWWFVKDLETGEIQIVSDRLFEANYRRRG